ncbi:MAG TPA: type II toxin-antitoxin system prevent-host-death family antitoxin [Casimicrobiaceae bacterium]|jgi:prevent-host-death family protein
MKRATISETKNRLSSLLEHVKRGGEVLILDRKIPVARIVPIAKVGPRDVESRLADLERRGVVRLPKKRPDPRLLDKLGPPPKANGDILATLLAEREEGL